jgi:gamma-tubulin complex component 3
MGQGDFIQSLMDHLLMELFKPAQTIQRNHLLGILETAIRASNAQFHSPEALGRVDIKLLESSPGDKGWDIFSLDYHVDPPISTILTPATMKQYLRIFNFLWRVKRV